MFTKTLIVVNGLTGQETPFKVTEGATPSDILSQMGLPNYQLARISNRQPLSNDCKVSCVVRDRERLFAFAPIRVGL